MHSSSLPSAPLKSSLIQALLSHDAYPHPVTTVRLLETHISWVLLTGEYAYKIKKPIALGFLDFSQLERRHFYCQEEVRLNHRWAPDLYLGVVEITNDNGTPRIGGSGPIIEYAVKMKQFADGARLDEQLESGELTVDDMLVIAEVVAAGHAAADSLAVSERQSFLEITPKSMLENFELLRGRFDYVAIRKLRQWTVSELGALQPLLERRIKDGFIRECHGDLHLANLVRLPTGISAFDCIEFSHDLRFIDVACDVAFLVMDLIARQQKELAFAFLNRYLEVTGDYESLKLFNLYFVYRCLVRAKVAAIRLRERAHDDPKIAEDRATIRHYCELASIQSATREPLLVLMHGLTASGKTVAAGLLSTSLPAIRVRSDIERKRLHGLGESADSGSAVGRGIYAAHANDEVYERLCTLAATILGANHDVILDASFLDKAWRDQAARVAEDAGAEFAIVTMVAPLEVLRCRLLRRRAQGNDASEGRAEVLEYQLKNAQPLTAKEQELTIKWQSTSEIDVGMMVAKLRCLQVQEMLPGAPEFPDHEPTATTSRYPL